MIARPHKLDETSHSGKCSQEDLLLLPVHVHPTLIVARLHIRIRAHDSLWHKRLSRRRALVEYLESAHVLRQRTVDCEVVPYRQRAEAASNVAIGVVSREDDVVEALADERER